MKIAFVVRSIGALLPSYTTTHLACEAQRRGHEVLMVRAKDLLVDTHGRPWARAYRSKLRDPASPAGFLASLRARVAVRSALALDGLDVLFLRTNPVRHDPAGETRLGAAVLHIAAIARGAGVTVVNDPTNLMRAGSKLYLMCLPREVRPRTIVTSDAAVIKHFLKGLKGPGVLKPAFGYGGESVFYVRRGEVANVNQYIASLQKSGYVIAQEYLDGARRGDKRLLVLDGEPVEVHGRVAIYKRIHARDDMRNNMHAGGRRARTVLTAAERATVACIAPRLREDGIYLAGVDLVDGKILEVNAWNPGGIRNINELYGIDVAGAVLDHLERRVATAPRLVALPGHRAS